MRYKKKFVVLLMLSILGFLIFSVSFLLMPIESSQTVNSLDIVSFLSGILFWLGLILGVVFQIVFSKSVKKYKLNQKIVTEKERLGLICFFKTKTAIVFDILTVLSLVGFVVSVVVTNSVGYSCYLFISITLFSFCMHCIFNGKNYRFLENRNFNVKSENKTNIKGSNHKKEKNNAKR